jgi:hypothetical protein
MRAIPEETIMTAIHEGGHGIAEQKIPREYYGMPIGTEPGMNIAEAESRLFENNLGRSKAFWKFWLPQMKKEFSPYMDNVSLEHMYRHVNRLNLGPIRVDADEISYILHIIIRYEIERDLFDGNISVDDLPRIWNQKYRDYLGSKWPMIETAFSRTSTGLTVTSGLLPGICPGIHKCRPAGGSHEKRPSRSGPEVRLRRFHYPRRLDGGACIQVWLHLRCA